MIINHIRNYREDYTEGVIHVHSNEFCHALEDVGRPEGVKLKGVTCIPEGVYSCEVSWSSRYSKEMILLSNSENKFIYGHNVLWSGIRVHGGNDVGDSEGCILVGYEKGKAGTIYKRASDDLCEMVKKEKQVFWIISSIRG